MSIIRHVWTDNYTRVPNVLHEAPDLSWAAKGLQGYLLSRPDGWEPKLAHLATVGTDGKQATRTARRMLIDAGWLVEQQCRNEAGQLHMVTWVFDSPGNTIADVPKQDRLWDRLVPVEPGPNIGPGVSAGQTGSDSPTSGKPDSGNSDPLVTTDGVREKDNSSARARARGSTGDRKKAARRIPDDWQPLDSHKAKAAELGLDVEQQAELFRLHAGANDRRQVDWDLAFHTWLRRAPDYRPRGRDAGGPVPAEWEPNESACNLARSLRMDCDREAAQFRDYAAARGLEFADVDAGFRKWLRDSAQRAAQRRSNGHQPRQPGEPPRSQRDLRDMHATGEYQQRLRERAAELRAQREQASTINDTQSAAAPARGALPSGA